MSYVLEGKTDYNLSFYVLVGCHTQKIQGLSEPLWAVKECRVTPYKMKLFEYMRSLGLCNAMSMCGYIYIAWLWLP